MVNALIKLNDNANRIINIVKAKYGLKDKSEAINIITKEYETNLLEPELRPEYIKKLEKIEKGRFFSHEEFEKEMSN